MKKYVYLIFLALLFLFFSNNLIFYLLVFAFVIFYIYDDFKTNPKHQITITLDSYGSIQIFDFQNRFIALVYRDHTIEYYGRVSYYQKLKISEISDYFVKYYNKLKDTDADK